MNKPRFVSFSSKIEEIIKRISINAKLITATIAPMIVSQFFEEGGRCIFLIVRIFKDNEKTEFKTGK
jgi:hypothetical protein